MRKLPAEFFRVCRDNPQTLTAKVLSADGLTALPCVVESIKFSDNKLLIAYSRDVFPYPIRAYDQGCLFYAPGKNPVKQTFVSTLVKKGDSLKLTWACHLQEMPADLQDLECSWSSSESVKKEEPAVVDLKTLNSAEFATTCAQCGGPLKWRLLEHPDVVRTRNWLHSLKNKNLIRDFQNVKWSGGAVYYNVKLVSPLSYYVNAQFSVPTS